MASETKNTEFTISELAMLPFFVQSAISGILSNQNINPLTMNDTIMVDAAYDIAEYSMLKIRNYKASNT